MRLLGRDRTAADVDLGAVHAALGGVIDPELHAVYDGPSSFVTWATRGPA